ncbi:hypothetical protein [Pontimicrobium sp. SW4]|uniref:Peptidase S74 domain-containing protein n=1 Tax=Pontimicrobium sp. SW4 TaxID=3153519 RepID=A0AAU7BQI1_9FLAO
MKKQILLLVALCLSMYSFSQVISNEAFSLSNSFGDLQMRRYVDGDLVFKRALVPSATLLNINYAGDFTSGVKIHGLKLVVDGNVGIGTANPGALFDIHSTKTYDHWLSRMNTNGNNWSGFWETSDNIRLLLRDTDGNIDVDLRPNGSSFINGGNLGIGITSPTAKLEINDDAATGNGLVIAGGGSGGTLAEFKRDIGATGSSLKIHASSNDPTLTFTNNTTNIFSIGVDGGSYKISDNATLGTNDRFVVNSNGNIGIGVETASSILDVKTINYGSNQEGGINLSSYYNNINRWTTQVGLKSTSGGSPRFAITTKQRDASNVEYANTEAISIPLNSGNVGIGTTTPDSKLTVKGNIHAEEVKVDLSVPGPDYVFNADYDLTSLETLQNYITKNKHLPNIPSAKEMEANGIELGVMNMKLLEKIEELTLYTLEQEEKLKNQMQINSSLNKRLIRLEQLLLNKAETTKKD